MPTTKQNYVPVTGATIKVFTAGSDMNTATPVVTLSAISGQPGNYKGESIDEGDYFLVAQAAGRGTVVHAFTLPNPTAPEDLIKYIGPLNMVAGLPLLTLTVNDKTGADVTTGIYIEVEKIRAEYISLDEYTVANVPVGIGRLIEIVPTDDTLYQNLKIYRDISNPMGTIAIILNPPVTLNITVRSDNGIVQGIDTTARLFEMVGNTKIREIQRNGNLFPITKLADGEITLRAYGPDGTTALGTNQTYQIRYSDTSDTGVLNRNYVYTTLGIQG